LAALITAQRSLIPACDVASAEELESLVRSTTNVPGIGAYKLGLELTIRYGLTHLVNIVRRHSKLPLIYDHQKGGTDIPELGRKFAGSCRAAGVDAVILFPLAGAETQRTWIDACVEAGLRVIVGGYMTQKAFLVSDGGFIADDSPTRIYELAAELGVTDFVVPGNQPEVVAAQRKFFERRGRQFIFYAPGFVGQGGSVADFARVAGSRWHAIVGAAIYGAQDPGAEARRLADQIRQT
jgi:orotidine-5'-phosphate decarboxylase